MGADLSFDIADRMRKALRVSGVGVQEMADYLDVARNTVGTWINGKVVPSTQTVRLFAIRTGVPFAWIKDGKLDNGPSDPDDGNTQGGEVLLSKPTVITLRPTSRATFTAPAAA